MRDLLLHNWHLKLISLALAAALWAVVARAPTSEIGMSVSLEYQNIPPEAEVFGDTADRVEVRLRGPSSVMRTVSPQDVSLSIDMSGMRMGQERVLPLSPELVHAPVGTEVIRVNPARVRLTLEKTARKVVPVVPTLSGLPHIGFEVEKTIVTPETIEIEGPSSHVLPVDSILTSAVNLEGRASAFKESVELDIQDPVLRVPKAGSVTVDVRLRRQSK
jgi:YbbR domain-containing protein